MTKRLTTISESRRRITCILLGASLFAALQHGGAAPAAELLDSSTLTKYVDPLPNPLDNLHAPIGTLGGKPLYEVTVSQFQQKLHRDLAPTTLWGYDNSFPGPTFVVSRDEWIKIRWINNLVDETGTPLQQHLLPYDTTLHNSHHGIPEARITTHVHGNVTDERSDGYPEYWFSADPNAPANGLGGPAGNQIVTDHYNRQRAANLWYHDHAMGITRLNVYAGMAGVYLVRDPQEQSLNLPSGKYEVPLVLQDRSFYDDGQLYYPNGLTDTVPGGGGHNHGTMGDEFPSDASVVSHFFGNANLVNGVVWPYMEVEPRKYRFRMLNGANARFYNLVLDGGAAGNQTFHQIGTEGGLLSSVVDRQQVLLSPADRADVIVDFSQFNVGDELFLRNTGPDDVFRMTNLPPNPNTTGQVMKFKVVGLTEPDTSALPDTLPAIDRYDPAEAVRTRTLRLTQQLDEFGRPLFLLDDKRWTDPVSEVVQMGELEIWEFDNRTPMAHPIHLHLDHFQVLDRRRRSTGQQIPLEAHELGWEDTVMVGGGEIVRVMVKFDQFAGKFVWHCHVLEHEDLEMMRPLVIVPRPVPEPATGVLLVTAIFIATIRPRRRKGASGWHAAAMVRPLAV